VAAPAEELAPASGDVAVPRAAAVDEAPVGQPVRDEVPVSQPVRDEVPPVSQPIRPSQDVPPPRGERLGSYELLLELASGGMATVHLARATDRRLGPPLVAIKRPHRHLSNDKTFVTMLVDEARLASAIDDPRVVKVRELGFAGGMPFIVMDYVEGASLAELRRELSALGRAIDVRVAVRIVLDALAGLHAAHALRDDNDKPLHIVHRDVSPHNVLLGCDGRSYITDFGIAKAEDRIQTTRTHEVKGKLAYLAPERVDKRRICTVQSDVFSMAVVLWECFAGRRLFRGDEAVDILQQVMSSPIPTLEQIGAPVPRPLDDVISRALSRDLDTRYQTARAFAQAIERAAGPEQIGTHADVARLMEAIFGARMAARQAQVRATVGNELADLLRESGLRAREPGESSDGPGAPLLAELAPPMPTGRYALGTELRAAMSRLRPRAVHWRSLVAVGAGAAIGAAATLTWLASHGKPTPIVVRPAASAFAAGAPPGAPATRRVLVPLPFLAGRIAFDEQARDLDPPTDIVSFDLANDAGARHHVTAIAPDGTRADGYALEEDGVIRAEADGYSFTAPPPPPVAEERRVEPRRQGRGLGTVHNGFTKLR
jgi:serine/threonine-protein kinase